MNVPVLFRQLGLLLLVLSFFLFGLTVFSTVELWFWNQTNEGDAIWAFLISALLTALIGGLCWLFIHPDKPMIGRREALLLVALSWLIAALLCALPYLLWAWLSGSPQEHPFRSPVNCYFESMSGLTTTGATIMRGEPGLDIASLPHSINLWRAVTHWLGGLGIVVLFVAVLPSLGVGGKRLYRIEAPGPSPEGVHPHIRETARILWLVYLGLTLLEILALCLAGLGLYDSVCHTFATLATGGFSTKNGSVGEINSVAADIIMIFFMILAGGNFALYYLLIRGKTKPVFQDVELKFYLFLVFGGALIVILCLLGQSLTLTTGETLAPSTGQAIRHGLFTTASIQTTTGFCTADFNDWPFLAKAVLVLLMFIGGCGGSTAGGIKVIRVWIALKIMFAELEKAFRPNLVRPIKVGTTPLDADMKQATLAYVLSILLLFALGSCLIMVLEPHTPEKPCTYTTASTASLATLCTIGPGLDAVGATANYEWFTDASKIVLILLMVIGRLEIFAIVVLFTPQFWRDL